MIVRLKRRREELRLSQQALATRVGVSRQALSAIEAGRQNPSVALALALARALQCRVEDLFALSSGAELDVDIVAPGQRASGPWPRLTERVAVGEVAGRWVAHRLDGADYNTADGLLGTDERVELFAEKNSLTGNVLVAGCAPLLGTLERSVGERFADVRMRWIRASSGRALQLLAGGYAHIAGIHLAGDRAGDDNAAVVAARFGEIGALIINLISWRQGLLVAPGNPLGLTAADLCRPGLRIAWREPGAGAHELLARTLAHAGVLDVPHVSHDDQVPDASKVPDVNDIQSARGPVAGGHVEVARAVASGAADVGVAIEAAAVAFGLDFIPLSQERFDLVLAGTDPEQPAVRRIFDAIDSPAFRAQAASFGGYSTALTGQTVRVAGSAPGARA